MPGFDFSNHNRNAALHARGVPLPKATSTGTTIVGCIYDGGVVVGVPYYIEDHRDIGKLTEARLPPILEQRVDRSWPTKYVDGFRFSHSKYLTAFLT